MTQVEIPIKYRAYVHCLVCNQDHIPIDKRNLTLSIQCPKCKYHNPMPKVLTESRMLRLSRMVNDLCSACGSTLDSDEFCTNAKCTWSREAYNELS